MSAFVALIKHSASLVYTSQLHCVEVQFRMVAFRTWLINSSMLRLCIIITCNLIYPSSLLLLSSARDDLLVADHRVKSAFERAIRA